MENLTKKSERKKILKIKKINIASYFYNAKYQNIVEKHMYSFNGQKFEYETLITCQAVCYMYKQKKISYESIYFKKVFKKCMSKPRDETKGRT